ncbi:MAG: 50S ribosomal protein L11 methyltransferase, partial [Actinobacteria bacterium]|nr:50S ribosomal protein L11 methyltransferase [Actinomycetota bacterium]
LDAVAVDVTRENARRNGLSVDVRTMDVLRDELPRADLVVANIELAAIEALLARLEAPRLIASGYPAGELPVHAGWNLRETLELEGWVAHVLTAS